MNLGVLRLKHTHPKMLALALQMFLTSCIRSGITLQTYWIKRTQKTAIEAPLLRLLRAHVLTSAFCLSAVCLALTFRVMDSSVSPTLFASSTSQLNSLLRDAHQWQWYAINTWFAIGIHVPLLMGMIYTRSTSKIIFTPDQNMDSTNISRIRTTGAWLTSSWFFAVLMLLYFLLTGGFAAGSFSGHVQLAQSALTGLTVGFPVLIFVLNWVLPRVFAIVLQCSVRRSLGDEQFGVLGKQKGTCHIDEQVLPTLNICNLLIWGMAPVLVLLSLMDGELHAPRALLFLSGLENS